MSYELINRITVKKNGVYISSHSNNDNAPYHSHRIESLSKVYAEEGQAGLDREVIRMFCEYAQPKGNHWSIKRYDDVLKSPKGSAIHKAYVSKVNEVYYALSKEDIASEYTSNKTNAWREYEAFDEGCLTQKYDSLVCLLESIEEYKQIYKEEKKQSKQTVTRLFESL